MPDQTERPYQVTIVCLGNICRSPIGEAVLQRRVDLAGLGDRVVVDSAGTGDWHVGQGANPRSIDVMDANGYEHDHTARQINEDWFATIDLVIAMDCSNYADLQQLIPESAAHIELRMLRAFDPALVGIPEPDPRLDVPDPYHGTDDDFEVVLRMIEQAVDGLVAVLPDLLSGRR
ncbi:MAG: low molecular weight phosphotyrosine protein phosphatase [Actinobacteria bacterium]|uniref:protein-tyrosine-phosphatase n=1 Tax=freshwater metagenome TaxID=449393 RepID=A0A6J7J297_9ZZZZ|nr:low molecular weight phosphotyrosine protein phosphatase [Actinomycetota bacterium]